MKFLKWRHHSDCRCHHYDHITTLNFHHKWYHNISTLVTAVIITTDKIINIIIFYSSSCCDVPLPEFMRYTVGWSVCPLVH